jgi:type IV secretion system protein VirD4
MKDPFNNAVGPQVRGSTPKAGKLIPALVVVSLAAGLQSATQFFAHDFGYQAALGRHFEHLYVPWSILQWAGQWYGQYPDAIMRAGSVGMIVTALGLLGLAVTKMVLANSSRLNPYLHGSARWANLKDIQASGLLPRPRTFWQAPHRQGRRPVPASMSAPGWTSGVTRITCATTARSMSCATRRRVPARGSDWWCRPSCRGARAPSSPT